MEKGVIDLNVSLGNRPVFIVGTRRPWLFSAFEAGGYSKLKCFSLTSSCFPPRPSNLEILFSKLVGPSLLCFPTESALVAAVLDEPDLSNSIVVLESKQCLSKSGVARLLSSPLFQLVVPGRLGSEGTRTVLCLPFSHTELGGVTDYQGVFSWYTASKNATTAPPPQTTMRRDMRFSLKSGTYGIPTQPPPGDPRRIHQRVRRLGSNSISCYGLYPWGASARQKLVTTHHSGKFVTRDVLNTELLRFWDVSETLDHLLEPVLDLLDIEEVCPVPIKVLSRVVEITSHSWVAQAPPSRKRSAPSDFNAFPARKVQRTDPDTSPVKLDLGETREAQIKSQLILSLRAEGNNPEGNEKAVKSDDAPPPTFLWDCYTLPHVRVTDPISGSLLHWERSFEILRQRMLMQWKRNRWRSAMSYLKNVQRTGNLPEDTALEAIRDALTRRLPGCTFFEWKKGSIPFFWEWSPEYQDFLHRGIPVWLKGSMERSERWRKPQPRPAPEEKSKIEEKLKGFIDKDYLRLDSDVDALISFFVVPKGDSDIRVVFDATKSGLNSHLEAPWFPLPTGDSLLRSVQAGTWMADNDVGECFYNWRLDQRVIPYTGIDLSCYFLDAPCQNQPTVSRRPVRKWFSWQRPPMGCRPAPFISARCMAWLKEETLGNRLDPDNVFQWSTVVLNCPGGKVYRPWLPPVFKQRSDGHIAADYAEFVDDRRPCGFSEEVCWRVAQRAASVAARHGVQDASRKRRPPSQEPGSWAGYVIHTTEGKVRGLVDQAKWDKTRARLKIIDSNLNSSGKMNHKELERYRGFFIYVARVYPAMKPYLKGIHGTLDSWRPTVDSEGWNIRWNRPSRKRKRDPEIIQS